MNKECYNNNIENEIGKINLSKIKNYRVDWVYFIFEENKEMIAYCKLKENIYVKYYYKNLTESLWYTNNRNIFIEEIKKNIDIKNYQSFLNLFNKNPNGILLTIKTANNDCTRCLAETLIIPNIFKYLSPSNIDLLF